MRAVLVDWLVEVQLQFKLLQETLFITVDIVDRYLAIEGKTVSRYRSPWFLDTFLLPGVASS